MVVDVIGVFWAAYPPVIIEQLRLGKRVAPFRRAPSANGAYRGLVTTSTPA